ncbi:MAG: phosphoenolpyruvate--protein phosphotransferase [Lentisphaeria bacterium]|jgi:phosphotransferase system enzyme I (PtsI)
MPLNSFSTASSAKSDAAPDADAAGLLVRGIGVSVGIAIGPALVLGGDFPKVVEHEIAHAQVPAEIERFREALKASRRQLEELKQRVIEALGEQDAGIFDAHIMIVEDPTIQAEVERLIAERLRNSDYIFLNVLRRYLQALQQVEDPYIRDRQADISDVSARIIRNIQGEKRPDLEHLDAPHIIVAHDISPSDTAFMHRGVILGFATSIGSHTSHTAIMARSFGVPAVVGTSEIGDLVQNDDLVIVDGQRGVVIVRPTAAQLADYQGRLRLQAEWFQKVAAEANLPVETIDGFHLQLAANIELPDEVALIKNTHGVGVGLYRTEYLFIDKLALPDEEQQFEAYRKVAEEIYPQSCIIRTLDIGGDKFLSHLNLPSELNPFLGVRAIRFCLQRPDIFLTQLRAILRASAHGKIRLMFPMIASVEELRQALELLKQARAQLDERGVPYNRHMDVGIMIEVPSAVMIADKLAPLVDFFSIGTNDLIQYSMAADRANSAVAYLYQPGHPAVIRMLRMVQDAAFRHGIWVSVCGEAASEPLLLPLLLGIGIQELSMSLPSIGRMKRLIRGMRMHEAEGLLRKAEACNTAAEVMELCEAYVRRIAPDVLGG